MNEAAATALNAISKVSSERLHRRWAQHTQISGGGKHYAILLGKTARSALRGLTSGAATFYHEIIGVDDRPDPPEPISAGTFSWVRAEHPIPGAGSAKAARTLVGRIADWRLRPSDTVVVSVGGGTSSMIAEARPPLTQGGLRMISAELLASGLDVTRINSLRGQLTTLHHGGLGARLRPAHVTTLLTSDNAQQRPDAVGSGPTTQSRTAPDSTALNVVPFELKGTVEAVLSTDIPRGGSHSVTELATVSTLASALERAAHSRVDTVRSAGVINSDWRTAADRLWSLALGALAGPGTSAAATAAGEITVPVTPGGTGGRCQQLAIAVAAQAPSDQEVEFEFAAIATDGRDHVEGVHGALSDTAMQKAIRPRHLIETLAATNTYPLLKHCDRLLLGSRTDDNLCDAYVLIVRRRA